MEINKETANRLWVKQFGKKIKARDFAGREMDKSAYNSRSSNFGWNVDHIFPESKGGKTNDSNLICCHIQTNSEKADKFPCFKANGKEFEIRRRQNHYEIFPRAGKSQSSVVNFLDGGQGIEFWDSCDSEPEYVYVGYAKIQVIFHTGKNPDFISRFRNFLGELFHTTSIFSQDQSFGLQNMDVWTFTVVNFDVPLKEDTQNLLDLCVALNTYVQYFFEPKYGCKIRIFCGMRPYESKFKISWSTIEQDIILRNCESFSEVFGAVPLAIHGMVKCNTDANDELEDDDYRTATPFSKEGYFPYDEVFEDLAKQLEKLR